MKIDIKIRVPDRVAIFLINAGMSALFNFLFHLIGQ